jgi:hypothetical protein
VVTEAIQTDKVLLEDQAAVVDQAVLVQQDKETLAALTMAVVVALLLQDLQVAAVLDNPVVQVVLDLRLLFLVQP